MIFYLPISQEGRQSLQNRAISSHEPAMPRRAAPNGMMPWPLTLLLALPGQSLDPLSSYEDHWPAAAPGMSRFIQPGLGRGRRLLDNRLD